MRKIKIIRILYLLFSFLFIFTLPFSIYNRFLIAIEINLSLINLLVLLFTIVEFLMYLISIILYFKKSDKTISIFNVAVFLTILYSFFIAASTYIPLISSSTSSDIFSQITGALLVFSLIIYFAYSVNKIGLKYTVNEIDKIGEKEI